MKYDIFLICPVRDASVEQKQKMQDYIEQNESNGLKVYYPARDTNQNDSIGYRICTDNKNAILNSKEIHIFWDINSKGSLFDLGVAFAFNKPIKIVNPESVDTENKKSFTNVITFWSNLNV